MGYGKSYLQAEQPRHTSDKTTDQTKFGMKNQKKNDHKNSGEAQKYRQDKQKANEYWVGEDGMLDHNMTPEEALSRHMTAKKDANGNAYPTTFPTGYPTRRPRRKTKYPTSAPTMTPTPAPTWNSKLRIAAQDKNDAFKKSIPKKIANFPEAIQTVLNAEVKAWTNTRYSYTTPHTGKVDRFQAFYGNMNMFYAMQTALKEANFQKAWNKQERHTFFTTFFYYVNKYHKKQETCKQLAAPLEANNGIVMYNQSPCKAKKDTLDKLAQRALKAANGEIWSSKKRDWM